MAGEAGLQGQSPGLLQEGLPGRCARHGDKLAGTLFYREAHCCDRETLRLDSKQTPFPRGSSDTGEGIWPVACFLVVSSGHWPESHGDGGCASGSQFTQF